MKVKIALLSVMAVAVAALFAVGYDFVHSQDELQISPRPTTTTSATPATDTLPPSPPLTTWEIETAPPPAPVSPSSPATRTDYPPSTATPAPLEPTEKYALAEPGDSIWDEVFSTPFPANLAATGSVIQTAQVAVIGGLASRAPFPSRCTIALGAEVRQIGSRPSDGETYMAVVYDGSWRMPGMELEGFPLIDECPGGVVFMAEPGIVSFR